jgi:hypothetical protein
MSGRNRLGDCGLIPRGRTPAQHEAALAAAAGGRVQAGSGASWRCKGDVDAPGWLIECKTTAHASLGIQWAWLRKISAEAVAVGKAPALAIRIEGGPADGRAERDWVLCPLSVWQRLVRAARGGTE